MVIHTPLALLEKHVLGGPNIFQVIFWLKKDQKPMPAEIFIGKFDPQLCQCCWFVRQSWQTTNKINWTNLQITSDLTQISVSCCCSWPVVLVRLWLWLCFRAPRWFLLRRRPSYFQHPKLPDFYKPPISNQFQPNTAQQQVIPQHKIVVTSQPKSCCLPPTEWRWQHCKK